MPPPSKDSPRKARKSMNRSGSTAQSSQQSTLNAVQQRTRARKSTGTRKIADASTDNSVLSKNDSRRPMTSSNRLSTNISQNTTVPFSQQGQSGDSDSSDSEVVASTTRRVLNRRTSNSQTHSQPSTSRTIQSNSSSTDSNDAIRRRRVSRKNVIESDTSSESDDDLADKKSRGNDSRVYSTGTKPASKKMDPRNAKISTEKRSFPSPITVDDSGDEDRRSSNSTAGGGTFKNLVNRCVYYILVADQKKYAIKKQDIIMHVFEKSNTTMYPDVMTEACKVLKKTFGLEILKNKDQKSYLLINILDRDLKVHDFQEQSSLELKKQGFIFYLLTVIFMNENAIAEEDLWKALEPLGISVKSRVPHPIFGDVKKFVTVELVKQMYLEHKCIGKDPPQYEFVWGERAVQEVGKEQLLAFACEIMNDTKPKDWLYQYNDAKGRSTEEN